MNNNIKAFTLVELVITISIVAILSTISTVIYKDYVSTARQAEGYTLLSRVRDAQLNYYSEYDNFLTSSVTSFEPVLGLNAAGNKYFKSFYAGRGASNTAFTAYVYHTGNGISDMTCIYNITEGFTKFS